MFSPTCVYLSLSHCEPNAGCTDYSVRSVCWQCRVGTDLCSCHATTGSAHPAGRVTWRSRFRMEMLTISCVLLISATSSCLWKSLKS